MCAIDVHELIDHAKFLRNGLNFVILAFRFIDALAELKTVSVAFAFTSMQAMVKAQWVKSLIDHTMILLSLIIFVLWAVGLAEAVVVFLAEDSVTTVFAIILAAAWAHLVEVLIDQAHIWLRVGVILVLIVFVRIAILDVHSLNVGIHS